jgi:putative PIN family toxin of toxin-antitoxin system
VIIATFDTNVLLSGLATRNGVPATLIDRWEAEAFAMALSEWILGETQRGFERPYFSALLTVSERSNSLLQIRRRAALYEPDPTVVGDCRDPDDDAILGTAVAANADYLVTGDLDLLALGSYREVRIVTPRDFLAVLDAATGEPEGEE